MPLLPAGDPAIRDRRFPVVGGFVDVDDAGAQPFAEMKRGLQVPCVNRADQAELVVVSERQRLIYRSEWSGTERSAQRIPLGSRSYRA